MSVKDVAAQALALAESNRRTLDGVLEVLGWVQSPLPVELKDIVALHNEATSQLDLGPDSSIESIRHWSRILLRINRPYLSRLQTMGFDRPWRVYLSLAEHLISAATPQDMCEQPILYGALDTARRNVQEAAYLLDKGAQRDPDLMELNDGFSDRVAELLTFLYKDNPSAGIKEEHEQRSQKRI